MSIKLMTQVWDASAFKGNQKLIMLCLSDFANDEGLCWPSIATIAKKCTVSTSTVKAQIRELMRAGFLKVHVRLKRTDDGKTTNDSNVYQILIGALKKAIATGGEFQPGSKSNRGQNTPLPGAESDPKPPIDPPITNIPPVVPPTDDLQAKPQPIEKRTRKVKTELPRDFALTEPMRQWYGQQVEFTIPIETATDMWADAMLAKAYKYVDWQSAWRNGMRKQNQWATQSQPNRGRPMGNRITQLPGANANYDMPAEFRR
ncbi:helix-turn-helix domain-containing protein [Celerinatantimonas sp. MCCC 1A17872]|uniref:helix-turn-helix domain-containing protein n=1 Tax=Celerinatantimonas sp. MCCC 1A17872 TaxID=3177514 RepID=UPI0038BEC618